MGMPKSRLRELRDYIKRGGRGTQRMLARAAGVSEPTFSKVLTGPRSFTTDAAGRLASLTGIPVEKLVTDPDTTRLLKLLGKRINPVEGNADDKHRVV